jgi:anti-sigma regulatory factor (Ser/Thr protein kinase)
LRWIDAFTFVGVVDEVPVARRRVGSVAERSGLEGRALFDFLLAVGEALNNAVWHGSPAHEYDEVTVRVGTLDHALVAEITDRGVGLERSPVCQPDIYEGSGRGIPFMRQLVDDLRYDCHDGGTTVQLLQAIR